MSEVPLVIDPQPIAGPASDPPTEGWWLDPGVGMILALYAIPTIWSVVRSKDSSSGFIGLALALVSILMFVLWVAGVFPEERTYD